MKRIHSQYRAVHFICKIAWPSTKPSPPNVLCPLHRLRPSIGRRFRRFRFPLIRSSGQKNPLLHKTTRIREGWISSPIPYTSLETTPSLPSILGLDSLYWGRDSEVHYDQQGGYSHDISNALPSPEVPPPPRTSLDTTPFLPPTMLRLDSSLPLTPPQSQQRRLPHQLPLPRTDLPPPSAHLSSVTLHASPGPAVVQ